MGVVHLRLHLVELLLLVIGKELAHLLVGLHEDRMHRGLALFGCQCCVVVEFL